MPPVCTICCDDEVEVVFECGTPDCVYCLCSSCLGEAFKDFSGANSRFCPMCKQPSTISMAEARIGKGGVRAVQRELRDTVEFEVRREQSLLEIGQKDASEMSEEALMLFNAVSEQLNMKCPRCEMVFHDYDGCNALTCSNPKCKTGFCAICLQDCGRDAHAHVNAKHGGLFDKKSFTDSRDKRATETVTSFLSELEEEGKSFELRQLVQNHLERAGHLGKSVSGNNHGAHSSSRFLLEATQDLKRVIAADRLSVLSSDHAARHVIRPVDISPRVAIPADTEIFLLRRQEGREVAFFFEVRAQIEDEWVTTTSLDDVKEWVSNGLIAPHGCLANLKQSLRRAVVAIEGKRSVFQVNQSRSEQGPESMALHFFPVDHRGYTGENEETIREDRIRILALNPNGRYLSLLSHIEAASEKDLMHVALRHFIGQGTPEPLFYELNTTVPVELECLNADQRSAGHPLCLKTAGEVAGPPGTGKTKTISELVRALLHCTNKSIIVLSERNGAIDAIADKFASLCYKNIHSSNASVKDLSMWSDIVTFGSVDAMGKSAKLFLTSEKVKFHPELLEAIKVAKEHKEAYRIHHRKMLGLIADEIQLFGDKFNDDLAWNQHAQIRRSNADAMKSANLLLNCITRAEEGASDLLKQKIITKKLLHSFVEDHLDLMRGLFPENFEKAEVMNRLKDIASRLRRVLQIDEMQEELIEELYRRCSEAEREKQTVEERVKRELVTSPRLKMSTIGSSHQLFSKTENDSHDIALRLDDLLLGEDGCEKDGAVVIFDESGCIPSYELLGLSRLDCPISAVLCVGDKKQLPPYNPSNNSKNRSEEKGLNSLLDVSGLREKISLRTQYRVPKDIARILDTRVYRGMFKTHRQAVAETGLEFRHVPASHRVERRRYVNSDEVATVLQLAAQKKQDGSSVMILTPYKNQQREIQFQLRRNPIPGLSEASVLTIDQCQGQESDVVLFTLVQKPTRFLNKNRLNVAMSRTRRELIFIADRLLFRQAAETSNWECNLMAKDVLEQTRVVM